MFSKLIHNKKAVVIGSIIAVIVLAIILFVLFLNPQVRVNLRNAQSCTINDETGAHSLEMEGVCGYDGMMNWDGVLMFKPLDAHISEKEYPSYTLCDGFSVKVKADPLSLSQEYDLIVYQKTESGLERIKRYTEDTDFGDLSAGNYLIECCCTVKKSKYYCTESAFFWLNVK